MNKDEIREEVRKLLNNEVSCIQINHNQRESAQDAFLVNTVIRLTKAYSLYKDKNIYKEDFLLALRDYLIVSDTTISLPCVDYLQDNMFGISYDEIEKKYFASYQLPSGINEKFVKDAFLRNPIDKKQNRHDNLLTDSMIYMLTGYYRFKSLDQKLAVYGALNTPDGYTTLVSLPTGGGKSLVTQTISYQKDGLTIVVVPTVSLAIDQERVTKETIKRTTIEEEVFSYSSGVDAGPILSAIKTKKARILFTSPEALLENPAFADTLKEASKIRYLKNIVIDEAHIVVDWGAAFRVDYQCLEAWRNMLMLSNPSLRTILLSATYEDKCVEILHNFFGIDDKWIEIRCDALRHEPRYCVIRTRNNTEKTNRIIELVRKLPHPMILYVARPLDAEYLRKALADVGINNVRTFTGLTGKNLRKKLIDEWVNNEFEIMIATSAFGVGVDKPDVRTVIHTYIPQNANTYYQELGRGGRDRLPCLSVMCLQPEDTTIGRDRIVKKVLTTEKIIGRWDSLYSNPKSVRFTDNRVYIDTSIKPKYADVDEFDDSPTSEADMNWNIYVLLFLRRYNMIRILEVKVEHEKYLVLIRIEDDRLRTMDEALKDHISKIREQEWKYYSDSYNAMAAAVGPNNKDCISELFATTYSKVFEYCAGCNAHETPIVGDTPKFPLKNRVSKPLRLLSDEQIFPFGSANEMVVIANETDQENLIDRLVRKGLSMLIVPDKYEKSDVLVNIHTKQNLMIVNMEEVYQLIKIKGFYFTSGLVAVVYPKGEKELEQQYIVVSKSICGKDATKIIHIAEKNAYISSAGKSLIELVNGPSLKSSTVFA